MVKVTGETLEKIRLEMIPHPTDSPDHSPKDYYLFRSLSNHLRGKNFEKDQQPEEEIKKFLSLNPPTFDKSGIFDLARR